MIQYVLVFETFVGMKSETYETHKEAFNAYKAIVHSEKGVYMVTTHTEESPELRDTVQAVNISFSMFEFGRVLAWRLLNEMFPNHQKGE